MFEVGHDFIGLETGVGGDGAQRNIHGAHQDAISRSFIRIDSLLQGCLQGRLTGQE